jgi:hypothetical protein
MRPHRGLVAGDEQQQGVGAQLVLGEPIAFFLRSDERAEQIVAGWARWSSMRSFR